MVPLHESHVPSDAVFDDCVRTVYRAALGGVSWRQAAEAIADAYGLFVAHFIGVDKTDGRLMFSWVNSRATPAGELTYITDYHGDNPRIAPAIALQGDEWVHDHLLFDDRFVARSAFFQDYAIPFGFRYLSGTKIVDDDRHVVLFGAVRSNGARHLNAGEMSSLNRLRGHMVDAMQQHLALREQSDRLLAGDAILEAMPQAIFLIDETRHIRYRNAAATQLTESGAPVRHDHRTFSLELARDDEQLTAELTRLVRNAHEHEHRAESRFAMRISARDSTDHLLLGQLVRPEATMKAFGNEPRVILILHPLSDSARLEPFLVARLFGLTPAEAEVAVRLARGDSPESIGRDRGVTVPTIRSQTRSVFEKVGVTRLAELAGVLARLHVPPPDRPHQ